MPTMTPPHVRAPRGRTARFAAVLIVLAMCVSCVHGQTKAPTPSADATTRLLEEAHAKYEDLKEGKNADYIPALAEVDSDLFGISLVTVDGKSHDVGDVTDTFSIQSISKVFTLAMAMQEHGAEAIREKIGVNATGRVFNSIHAIEDNKARSVNSCVNAGAIATTSLIGGKSPDEKWEKIQRVLGRFAGRELGVDQGVCQSELDTNQRNQAIGMLLNAYGRIYDDPLESVEVYTKQCAISVSSHDLAVMAATLANGGVNPVTNDAIVDGKYIPRILAVMTTAGLYDDSGTWLFQVGLPGKSGVGGGIIAVAPGKFGIAAFAPPLDAAGNSVKAQKCIAYVVERLGAGLFEAAKAPARKD